MKAGLYFLCHDPAKDPVAHAVFKWIESHVLLEPTDWELDGFPVLRFVDRQQNQYLFARTAEVASHDFSHYLRFLQQRFNTGTFVGIVNWHEGNNAPEHILTIHTNGDVPSGHFCAADPMLVRAMLLTIERNRIALGLSGFTTLPEATHYSGIPYGGDPALLSSYSRPVIDIEIGSSPVSWSDQRAVEVLGRSCLEVFDPIPSAIETRSLLCAGGTHFEPGFRSAIFNEDSVHPLAISHILPNQWLTGYDSSDGARKLDACVASIAGGVNAIVFHDNLKGPLKQAFRDLGDRLGVPVVKHQALRRLAGLPIWHVSDKTDSEIQ